MKTKKRISEKKKSIYKSILGVVITVLFLFPLYWMVTTALRTPGETFSNPTFFPRTICFDSFVMEDRNGIGLLTYLKNSIIISAGATILGIGLAVPASYGLARFKSKLVGFLLFVFLVAQMLPSSLILTPLFINFNKLGLINNYLGVILADATLTIPFSVIILRTYFKDIPKELEEAAIIDGCGPFKTFLKIMIPISYPGIATATAMSLFMAWGDMVFSLTFLNKENLKPLSLILYKAMGELGVRWEILMAYSTIVVIPIVIVFVFLQKYIVSGLTAGSVKG
ncbi:MAG: carbohydrate ABC transporter permease [Hespellia sp.]|nr:carbohydrate ABC transporter permease [Hespellia sp.]